ncbi:hypothetical protein BFR06_20405 [Burkholderia pseudomallei]|nr:hypothetical protein BFR05_20395 [Burkholderia pseudomallei]APG00309.1 hypothetical protein BFR06_20405 [Burkholderia pseudomallei]KEO70071.1 hypothetical protein J103_08100 [Burkholderia pseudomallei MSHR5855]
MVEQSLIHVPNLFDIERTERQPTRLNPAPMDTHSQKLQRLQQMQYRAVIDWKRCGWRINP